MGSHQDLSVPKSLAEERGSALPLCVSIPKASFGSTHALAFRDRERAQAGFTSGFDPTPSLGT